MRNARSIGVLIKNIQSSNNLAEIWYVHKFHRLPSDWEESRALDATPSKKNGKIFPRFFLPHLEFGVFILLWNGSKNESENAASPVPYIE